MTENPFNLQAWQIGKDNSIRNSVYWNANAQHPALIDLCDMDHIGEAFGQQVLKNLLQQQPIDLEITPAKNKADKLFNIFRAALADEKIKGIRSVAIGFPIVSIQDPYDTTRQLLAPLLIWSCRLNFSDTNQKWKIRQGEFSPIVINKYLSNYLEKNYDLSIDANLQKIISSTIDAETTRGDLLKNYCTKLMRTFKQTSYQFEKISTLPITELLANWNTNTTIYWSGLLGIFPPQANAIQAEDLQGRINTPQHFPPRQHPFGLLANDPFQENALANYSKNYCTVLRGGAGTGKTYALSNIISNALSNEKNCLVVSTNYQNLKKIKATLTEQQLGQLSFLFKDKLYDKTRLLEDLKQQVKTKNPSFKIAAFQLCLNKCKRLHQKLEEAYHSLKGPIFGHSNWTNTVGLFLKANRLASKALLNYQLDPKDYAFSFSEYQQLEKTVTEGQGLYQNFNLFNHPLQALHPQFFQIPDQAKNKNGLQKNLNLFLQKATQLQYRYITKLDSYGEKLNDHYSLHFDQLSQQIQDIKDKVADNISLYGESFKDSNIVSKSKVQVYGVFSQKYKDIKIAREEINAKLDALKTTFFKFEYFEFQFSEKLYAGNIEKLESHLQDFETLLLHWRRHQLMNPHQEIYQLNSDTVHKNLDYEQQITALEYALEVFIEELNDAQIFQKKWTNQMQTIPQRQQLLEDIIAALEEMTFHVRDFDNFFNWQYFWQSIGHLSQQLIRALVKVKPSNWTAAFQSWYLYNRLLLEQSQLRQKEDHLLDQFIESYSELQSMLAAQIQVTWKGERKPLLDQLKKTDKVDFLKTFGLNNHFLSKDISLKELFLTKASLISRVYPVILSSPEVALLFVEKQKTIFDLLIIDDAHQLYQQDTIALARHARQIIIAGNPYMPSLAKGQSSLDYWNAQSTAVIDLNYQHTRFPLSLQAFANAVFYGHQLKLTNTNLNTGIQLKSVAGIYNSATKTNSAEATAIIHFLKTNQPDYSKGRLAIVCPTYAQRDLIARQISSEKATSKPMDYFTHFEEKDLVIYHISELAGLSFDQVIFSTTIDQFDVKSLTKFFQPEERYYYFLQLLVSAVKDQLLLVNSFGAIDFAKDWEQPQNNPAGIFRTLMAYSQSIIVGDQQKCEAILAAIPLADLQLPKDEKKYFVDEIQEALQPYFEPGSIERDKQIGAFKIPLYIHPIHENEKAFAILADGFFNDTHTGAFLWEHQLSQQISDLGITCFTVWSERWWKQPKQEARKLASLILKNRT